MKCFIIAALTVDGYIARETKQISTVWTSKADKKRFIELTKLAGVIIMGLNTFNTIGKPLPGRLNIIYAPKDVTKIEGVEITDKDPRDLLLDLEKRGFKEVAICGGSMIYTLFMKAGVVDTLYLTKEPVIFGSGLRLFRETLDYKLELVTNETVEGGTILLEYKVIT